MRTYKEFLDHVAGRAAILEQKGRQLNGKLKRAITALSHDPKSAPEGPLGLDDLKSMSEMMREVRNRTLLSRMNSLIQAMVKADKELSSLDGQIDRDLLAIHSSIFEDGSIPPEEAERLAFLFTKWRTVSATIESAHRTLSKLAERLEMAIEAADTLESASIDDGPPSEHAGACPPGEKNGTRDTPAAQIVTVVCSVQELLELKNLLVSIMAAYIHREEFSFELPYCCAKIAACKLAHIQSPRPIKYHRKPRIKDAVRVMERKLAHYRETGEETARDIALFHSLMQSCRSTYLQLPEDVRKSETMSISRYLGFRDSGASLAEFFDSSPDGEIQVEPRLEFTEMLRRATGYDRIFLLEMLEAFPPGNRSLLEQAVPEVALENDMIRGSLMLILQATDHRIFYTREWVAAMLHRFVMDDYAILIPPVNFAHERKDLERRDDDEGHEDAFSSIARMAKLIR